MKGLTLNEFVDRSCRMDQIDNDRQHFFSSHFAKYFAYLFFRLGVSPNSITFLFLLAGIGSAFLFYQDEFVLAYISWRLHLILDMADGQVARATGKFSKSAVGFDRSNHIIINVSVMFAISGEASSVLVMNLLIVTFFLYYFFSRNYSTGTKGVFKISRSKAILRNIIGLEGFVIVSSMVGYAGVVGLTDVISIIYSAFFLVLFFYKLTLFQR